MSDDTSINNDVYRQIVENAREGVWLGDASGQTVYASPRLAEILGRPPQDMLRRSLAEILDPRRPDRMRALIEPLLLAGCDNLEIEAHKPNGEPVWLLASAAPLDPGSRLHSGSLALFTDITERKRAADALAESEFRFRELAENITQVFWVRDLRTGEILYVSPAYESIWGRSCESLYAQPNSFLDSIHPDDAARVQAASLKQAAGSWFNEEYRIVRPDGQVRWVWARTFPVRSASGEVYRVVGVSVDITERKQAQIANSRLTAAVEQSAEGMLIVSARGRVLYLNAAFERISGRRAAELAGRPFADLRRAWPNDPLFERLGAALSAKSGYSETLVNQRPEAGEIVIEITIFPVKDEGGEILSYTVLARDVSERRRHELELQAIADLNAALRRTTKKSATQRIALDQIYKALRLEAVALATLAPGGRLYIELGLGDWADWTGVSLPSEAGVHAHTLQTGAPYFRAPSGPEPAGIEIGAQVPISACFPLIAHNQTVGALSAGRKAPFTRADGRLLTTLADIAANALYRSALFEDLQEQVHNLQVTQAQLVQSEKLAAIGELVAGVAHELNNPLTSIILYSQIMAARPLEAQAQKDLANIISESQRAAKIVHGLLDFARQRPPERNLMHINSLIQAALDLLQYEITTRSVQVTLDLDPGLPETVGDPHQMQQVFMNLINNALQTWKAGSRGGELTIRTRLRQPVSLAIEPPGAQVIAVEVHDNGPGIAPHLMTKIFDPFFTTKAADQGTGLGLSICHGIVSEHNGHIWAENGMQQGAVFQIELPVQTPESFRLNTGALQLDRPLEPGAPLHILLIDDEQTFLDILTRLLTSAGMQVTTAAQTQDAIAALKHANFDVILCDVFMPGVNGVEFFNLLAREYPALTERVLFTAGDVINYNIRRFFAESGAPFISKPFGLQELLEQIKLLGNRES